MYSLICRHAKIGLIPSQESGEGDVELKPPDNGGLKKESKLKTVGK